MAKANYLVFDTETSGLPECKATYLPEYRIKYTYFDPSDIAKYKNSRIIELAYRIVNEKNETLTSFEWLEISLI